MRSGLEFMLGENIDRLVGKRVGFVCNHTAVDRRLRHGIDRLHASRIQLVRLFGPEHGIRATAQDMEGVEEFLDPVTGIPTVSLYGKSANSLRPGKALIEDLDVILFDIQDIGARYYTYQATLGFVMEVAGPAGVPVIVLDRPNPINGLSVEGNLVQPGFESFVGAYPLAVRHGMTVAELSVYFQKFCGVSCEVEVIRCEGWERAAWFDHTDLPWVYPSPNMPTLDTATVYPGTCLIEGTNLSEGRGTTRPFHLVGAPWLDPQRFTKECEYSAAAAGLQGVAFRPSAFIPGFQKHAGKRCGGVEIHVTQRARLNTFLLGMVVIEAARRCNPEKFAWRTEEYEFVKEPIAIDLLTGSTEFRQVIENGQSLKDLLNHWKPQLATFLERRRECLLYE
jgi:uncharacterized protein YbbC (DUF1343 family)